MQRKLTSNQAQATKDAANLLVHAFPWENTPEGYSHWEGVWRLINDKGIHGTSDGKPWVDPDPPLTDRDACVWPRLLVMVRSDDLAPWEGPYAYLGKTESFYAVDSLGVTVFVLWAQARRATPDEIKAAK